MPFAVNLAATEANATVQPFLPLAERLGRLFTALAGGIVDTLEISYEGQIADYDCRVLTLSVLKGVLGPVVDEPVSFVNAPQLAEERGLVGARDDVVVGARLREPHRAARPHRRRAAPTSRARCTASRTPRASSRIDDHIVDLPPSSHMLVVRNDDTPGMIGTRRHDPRRRGINIDDLDLGRGPQGDAALMVLSTSTPVPAEVVDPAAGHRRHRRRPRHRARLTRHRRSRPLDSVPAGETVACYALGGRGGRRPRRRRPIDVAAVGAGCGRSCAPPGTWKIPLASFALTGWVRRAAARRRGSTHGPRRLPVCGRAVSAAATRSRRLGGGRGRRAVGLGTGAERSREERRSERRTGQDRESRARCRSDSSRTRAILAHVTSANRRQSTLTPHAAVWQHAWFMTKELRTQSLLLT